MSNLEQLPADEPSFKTVSEPSRSPERALPSKPPGSAESVEPAAPALGRRASDKPGRRVFNATQLRPSPSDLFAPGPDERVIDTVVPPRTIPLLPNLARTRRIATSDGASRELVPPTRAHDSFFSVPQPHDDTLDFSIEPASYTAVAANDDSAWKFRTAVRFNTTVRGGNAAAREIFPAPRPQDGTPDFSIESTSLAAAATSRGPSSSSTASNFTAADRKSDAVAREYSPTPRSQDGTLDFGIAPALPAAVPAHAVSAEKSSTATSFDAGVKGSDMDARVFFPRLAQ